MKILFSEYSFGEEQGNKWFNTGIAALSAFLKREGHEVFLARFTDDDDDGIYEEAIRRSNPDLIAYSSMSFQWLSTARMAKRARKTSPGTPIIVGGYHPTFHTEQVMSAPDVDYACVGEGEETMLDFVNALEGSGDIYSIPGLWSRKNGSIIKNAVRPPIADLDSLPHWDREVFEFDELIRHHGRATMYYHTNSAAVAAVRGCPWTCTYCSNEAYLKLYQGADKFVRTRSVPHFLAELRDLRNKYSIRQFEFWDEIFGLNRNWMNEFADAYKSEFPGIPYSVLLRQEQTRNDDFLQQLSDSGCWLVAMGLESGDEEYRAKYLNRKMSNQSLIESFQRVRDFGMETNSLCMIGLPFETPEQMRKTLEINRVIEPDVLFPFIFQPFPGTTLYEICKENDWLPDESFKPYWTLRPEMALNQPSYTQEEIRQIHTEFQQLRLDLDKKTDARRQARFEGVATPPPHPMLY